MKFKSPPAATKKSSKPPVLPPAYLDLVLTASDLSGTPVSVSLSVDRAYADKLTLLLKHKHAKDLLKHLVENGMDGLD